MHKSSNELSRVNFKNAKLLKELCFDLPTKNYYIHYYNDVIIDNIIVVEKGVYYDSCSYFKNNWSETDFSNEHYGMFAAPYVNSVIWWLYKHNIIENISINIPNGKCNSYEELTKYYNKIIYEAISNYNTN